MFKKKCENISNKYYNIASKFVSSNSMRERASYSYSARS